MLLASSGGVVVAILFAVVLFVVLGLPAFTVGKRRAVDMPGVAFVPLIGPTIVILWSINRSGWLAILQLIPVVAIVFGIWLVFSLPAEHGRTRWWALPFLIPILNLVAFYVYAFTLEREDAPLYS